MKKTVIIIPSRLDAKRLPNKPLKKINGIPMIVHVFNRAKESNIGEVFVATPDKEIADAVKQNGGEAVLTNQEHFSGTDRVYEAYLKKNKDDLDMVINLQGDMPNINPSSILKLERYMRKGNYEIGTLASTFKDKSEIIDPNVVKVQIDEELNNDAFFSAKDFFRVKKDLKDEKIYYHIGIYAFTTAALSKYVKLSRSKLELERNLEQMRALENNISIKVGLSNSKPLSVDTEADLEKVEKDMNLL